MSKNNYQVEIIKAEGTCQNKLLLKMLEKGDINFLKLENIKDLEINVLGFCSYKGTYDGKTNTYLLVHCEHGYIRTASNNFIESFTDYIDEISHYFIRAIECSKGITYKCEPIL